MTQWLNSICNLYNRLCRRFSWLHNFVLYAVIGVMAAILDYSIFYILRKFVSLSPETASLIGNLCGFFFTFSGNTFYNFKKSSHVLFRFISYFCITIGGMTLSTLLIHFGKEVINVYLLKAFLVLVVIPSIQFILNKKITYRDFPPGDTNSSFATGQWWREKTFLQKFFILFLLFSVVIWVVVPASYTVSLPVDPPETLMWGSTFNWGNAKHPPMSGYMLFNFCKLFGFKHFSIFLLGEICMLIGFVYTYKLARCFFDRDKSVIAALLITFYAFYTVYIPKFNANIPHVIFLPMMYYYFYRGCFANKWHHWILFAASAAGACLSKYSAGAAGLALVIFIFADKNARKVLLSVKPYVGGAIFAILMVPHILHLINTGFLTFNYLDHGEKAKFGYWGQLFMLLGSIVLPILCMSAFALVMHFYGNRKLELKLKVTNSKAMWYSGCIIGGQAAVLILMGILGHRLDTEWTFPLFFTAGIFIMSFHPGEINAKSKRCFAVLCTTFTVILAMSSFISHHCKTKSGYHINMNKVRCIAEDFYKTRTGNEIPFITGSLWQSSMLQNSFKYTVKSAPSFDPILMGLHSDIIAKNGALVIAGSPENEAVNIKKMFDIQLEWEAQQITYNARFGKKKTFKFYLAVIPPGSQMKAERKK